MTVFEFEVQVLNESFRKAAEGVGKRHEINKHLPKSTL